MSYSFSVRAASKAAAKAQVAEELAKVVANQPEHAVDQAQAKAAADAFIDILADDDSKDVVVSMHGSVGWMGGGSEPKTFTAAGVGASAYLTTRG